MVWSEGVTVTVPDQSALLEDLGARLAANQGFAVATLNLDHAVKLSRNAQFRDAYRAQTHITADGNPVVWLSRLAGQQDVALVPGSELIAPLVALAARQGVPVAFFGATEEALQARHPGLNIALTRAPAMGFDPLGMGAAEDIAALKTSGARLCFLALGAPKQEIFAARAHAALAEVGFVSIGAGLDFIAGTQKRAPAWARAMAAEWLWRLLCSPARMAARYGACILALPGLTLRAMQARRGQNHAEGPSS